MQPLYLRLLYPMLFFPTVISKYAGGQPGVGQSFPSIICSEDIQENCHLRRLKLGGVREREDQQKSGKVRGGGGGGPRNNPVKVYRRITNTYTLKKEQLAINSYQ